MRAEYILSTNNDSLRRIRAQIKLEDALKKFCHLLFQLQVCILMRWLDFTGGSRNSSISFSENFDFFSLIYIYIYFTCSFDMHVSGTHLYKRVNNQSLLLKMRASETNCPSFASHCEKHITIKDPRVFEKYPQ